MMLRFRGQLVLLFICLSLIGTQSVVQDDDQNSVQSGVQNGAQSVVQDSVQNDAQNGPQNGAQSGAQNGPQSGVQNGAQNGPQSGAQSINSDVCLLHDPPNSPSIPADSNTCREQRFRVNTNSKEVILQGYFEDIEKVKDEALYQYKFGNCMMGFKIHNPDPSTIEPLLEFLTLNGFPPSYNIKYRLGLTFSFRETEIHVYDGYNAFDLPCNPLSELGSNYVVFDFKQKISVPAPGYSLLFVGDVSDSDVTEVDSSPGVVTPSPIIIPTLVLPTDSSSSTSGVVTTTPEKPSVLTTTVSSSTSSSTTTTSKPTTTTSKLTTTTPKPTTTTPKPSTSSSTTTKATTTPLTSTVLTSTVEPSNEPDQSNLQQGKTTSNNKPLKITLFVLLLIAVAALFVILALFGVVFYRMKKGIKSTFIGNKSVTQETI